MKLIDDFMEKKTQDALRKENEQIERKARLSELESRKKQKRNAILHPIKTVNERKEIKDLKKEISTYEKEKEDRGAIFAICGLLAGLILLLFLSSAFHKPSDDSTGANETTVAETSVEAEKESVTKGSSTTGTFAISDNQSNTADSTVNSVVDDAGANDESGETEDQQRTETDDVVIASDESAVYGILSSDIRVSYVTDYIHFNNDMVYLGNNEGTTITIETDNEEMEIEDLIFDYDTSLLNVDIEEPVLQNGKTIISAYVTANEECNTELFITTEYELETTDGDMVNGKLLSIKKLDSSEGRPVYITPTGTKYHFDANCAGENAMKTTYHDVAMLEIEPCGTCAD